MSSQTRDVLFASFIAGAGLLACMSGAAWVCVGAINLFRKDRA